MLKPSAMMACIVNNGMAFAAALQGSSRVFISSGWQTVGLSRKQSTASA
jgi:hypothetical protein